MSLDLKAIDSQVDQFLAGQEAAKASGNLQAVDICGIYNGAGRVVLSAVASILNFFKPSWGQVINLVIATLDGVCPKATT
jgi:hypothetical protein